MSENPKVSASHRQRAAIVYVRQSTMAQLERNRESTARQYDLVEKAVALGWPRGAVRVVDEDSTRSRIPPSWSGCEHEPGTNAYWPW